MLENEGKMYLQSYQDYFWEWEKVEEDDSLIAVLVNGPAIAHFNVIESLIRNLDGNSLPPLGVLLLLLFASRPQTKLKQFNDLSQKLIDLRYKNTGIKGGFVTFNSAMKLLKLIVKLPDYIKTDLNRKLLISSLLNDCVDPLGNKVYKQLLETVNNTSSINLSTEFSNPEAEIPMAIFYKEIRVLSVLSVQYSTTEKLLELLKKDKPSEDVHSINSDVKAIYLLPDFIELMQNYEALYKTSALIKYLWSGIYRFNSKDIPSKQPLGGVTDITNKGDFDRMLISEFAYSEDMFLSRLANSDILFRDREAPPQKKVTTSIYLLDISLISWGVPKVIELAIFLSFISKKNSKHINRLITFGEEANEMPFATISDLYNLHNSIDESLHGASGLDKYLNTYIKQENTEVIVLTADESYELLEVKNTIDVYRGKIDLLITASRFGEVNIWSFANLEKINIQHLILPLDDLWEKEYQPISQSIKSPPSNNGLINFEKQYPLLFPWSKYGEVVYKVKRKFYLLYDNSVWLWSNENRGLEFIIGQLPIPIYSKLSTIALDIYKHGAFFTYDKGKHCILKFSFKDKSIKEIALDHVLKPKLLRCSHGKLVIQDFKNKSWQLTKDNRFICIDNSELEQVIDVKTEINECYTKVKQRKVQYNVLKNIERLEFSFNNDLNKLSILHLGDKHAITFNDHYLKIKPYLYRNEKTKDSQQISFNPYANLYLKRIEGDLDALLNVLKRYNIKRSKDDLQLDIDHLSLIENKPLKTILSIKKDLENCGAICYYKISEFKSSDGSQIVLYKGVIEFTSSDPKIKPFYMPSAIDIQLGMASEDHFSGNTYFFNDNIAKIEFKQFYEEYIHPFIETIKNYGH